MRTLMFNVLRNWSVISGDVIPKKKIRIVLIRNTCWSRRTWFAFLCMISDYIYYKKVKPPLLIHSEFYMAVLITELTVIIFIYWPSFWASSYLNFQRKGSNYRTFDWTCWLLKNTHCIKIWYIIRENSETSINNFA